MTQRDRDSAVATGESLLEICHRGLGLADPVEVAFDPEPSSDVPPRWHDEDQTADAWSDSVPQAVLMNPEEESGQTPLIYGRPQRGGRWPLSLSRYERVWEVAHRIGRKQGTDILRNRPVEDRSAQTRSGDYSLASLLQRSSCQDFPWKRTNQSAGALQL